MSQFNIPKIALAVVTGIALSTASMAHAQPAGPQQYNDSAGKQGVAVPGQPSAEHVGLLIIRIELIRLNNSGSEARTLDAITSFRLKNLTTGRIYSSFARSGGVRIEAQEVAEGIYCLDSITSFDIEVSYCDEPFFKVLPGRVNNAGWWRIGYSLENRSRKLMFGAKNFDAVLAEAETYEKDLLRKYGSADEPKVALEYSKRSADKRLKGDIDGAIADATQAISLDPKLAAAYNERGLAKRAKGDVDGAITDFTSAIALDPKRVAAYVNRGFAKRVKGDFDGAVADATRAIELDPNQPMAYNNLAWLLATAERPDSRDGGRAVELALKACELSQWKNANFMDTLAAAYARVGNFDEAVKWQRKAMEDSRLASDNDRAQRLRQYQEGKAWPQ